MGPSLTTPVDLFSPEHAGPTSPNYNGDRYRAAQQSPNSSNQFYGDAPADPPVEQVWEEDSWDPEDVERAKSLFLDHGKNFHTVALALGNKTILQCRKLYVETKRRYGVDLALDSRKGMTSDGKKKEKKKKTAVKKRASPVDFPDEESERSETEKRKAKKEEEGTSHPGSPSGEAERKEKRRTVSYWTAKEKADFLKLFKVKNYLE
jgi:hypothetical protein